MIVILILLALAGPGAEYHYSDCAGVALRVYEGPCGAETGLRFGVPVYSPYVWTDAEIPDLCETRFDELDGCTVTALWAPGWRPRARLVTTYEPETNTWSLPEIREEWRVMLPLIEIAQ